MKQSGVYQIFNHQNGKIYIGSSQDIKNRWHHHRWALRNNKHPNKHLQNAWNKYGFTTFSFSIIQLLDIKYIIQAEQYWINYLKPEYNIVEVITSPRNKPLSQEHKDKISRALKNKTKGPLSKIVRDKIKSTRTRRPVIGIKPNGETIRFSSITKAAESGFSKGHIRDVCLGKKKTHHGLQWFFEKEEKNG